jgi:hypothetical protein
MDIQKIESKNASKNKTNKKGPGIQSKHLTSVRVKTTKDIQAKPGFAWPCQDEDRNRQSRTHSCNGERFELQDGQLARPGEKNASPFEPGASSGKLFAVHSVCLHLPNGCNKRLNLPQ